MGCKFPIDMIVLKDQDIDVIFGMNWLTQHEAIVDANQWTVKLNAMLGENSLVFHLPFIVKVSAKTYGVIV